MINSYPFYPQYNYRMQNPYRFSRLTTEETVRCSKEVRNNFNNRNVYNSKTNNTIYANRLNNTKSTTNSSCNIEHAKTILKSNHDKPMFEILGIKLFQDDILLICLIFFLYNEGIKDEFLFFSLVLLLLS